MGSSHITHRRIYDPWKHGSWIQDPVSWILDSGEPGLRIIKPGSRMQDPCSRISTCLSKGKGNTLLRTRVYKMMFPVAASSVAKR